MPSAQPGLPQYGFCSSREFARDALKERSMVRIAMAKDAYLLAKGTE